MLSVSTGCEDGGRPPAVSGAFRAASCPPHPPGVPRLRRLSLPSLHLPQPSLVSNPLLGAISPPSSCQFGAVSSQPCIFNVHMQKCGTKCYCFQKAWHLEIFAYISFLFLPLSPCAFEQVGNVLGLHLPFSGIRNEGFLGRHFHIELYFLKREIQPSEAPSQLSTFWGHVIIC